MNPNIAYPFWEIVFFPSWHVEIFETAARRILNLLEGSGRPGSVAVLEKIRPQKRKHVLVAE